MIIFTGLTVFVHGSIIVVGKSYSSIRKLFIKMRRKKAPQP
jgi:hypothetical protein